MAEGKKTGGRKSGTPNKETVAKQILFNNLWDEVSGKITGEGISRCWQEMTGLSGKEYVYAYMGLLEYFRPKLQRQEHVGDNGNPIQHSQLTFEEAYQLKYGCKPDAKAD